VTSKHKETLPDGKVIESDNGPEPTSLNIINDDTSWIAPPNYKRPLDNAEKDEIIKGRK